MRGRGRWVSSGRSQLPLWCHHQRWLTPFLRYNSSTTAAPSVLPRPNYLPLSHFIPHPSPGSSHQSDLPPYVSTAPQSYHIEVYGCQMNSADADLINAILLSTNHYHHATDPSKADIILLITCAIRDNAEQRIWNRLRNLQHIRERGGKIALLGCMAERLKFKLLEGEGMVDVICGPDAYRDLPSLLAKEGGGGNVMLSVDETYADILPVQIDRERVTACISIMRGCNNMCTYCIVPFVRGTVNGDDAHSRQRTITADGEYFK